MKTAKKSIWWNILRITGNILYIVILSFLLFFFYKMMDYERFYFGPEFIISECDTADWAWPSSAYYEILCFTYIVCPFLLYSFVHKLLINNSKFMKGYSVLGILITLAEMGWVIFVPQYVAWHTVLLATVIIFAIRLLFHIIYRFLLRKVKQLYAIVAKKNPTSG